ncbi:hypothetical protein [Aureimonas sp. AU40]|uniref:hypothetical protein n=1 Tax=Aureimonas sp. AU40 TaxID=1637747 RepID=UPI000780A8C6|nr:hypothetical protein [Aureimonas sp. AU40]
MGFVFLLMLAAMVGVGVWAFATDAGKRAEYLAEWRASPISTTATLVFVALTLLFFACVFVPPLGMVEIRIDRERWHLWSLTGITLIGYVAVVLVVMLVLESRRESEKKRRRGR